MWKRIDDDTLEGQIDLGSDTEIVRRVYQWIGNRTPKLAIIINYGYHRNCLYNYTGPCVVANKEGKEKWASGLRVIIAHKEHSGHPWSILTYLPLELANDLIDMIKEAEELIEIEEKTTKKQRKMKLEEKICI